MELNDFSAQFDLLSERYGKKNYTPVIADIMLKEFKHIPLKDFQTAIRELLSTQLRPVVVADIRAQIAKLREYTWNNDKKESAKMAKNVMDIEEFSRGFGMIGDCLTKGNPESIKKMSEFVNKVSQADCHWCDDVGVVNLKCEAEQGNNYIFKCFCKHGKTRPEAYPDFKILMLKEGFYLYHDNLPTD